MARGLKTYWMMRPFDANQLRVRMKRVLVERQLNGIGQGSAFPESNMSECKARSQSGSGVLILKDGTKQPVTWEVELFGDRLFGAGRVWGETACLKAATKDGCAILKLDHAAILAVAIDRCDFGEAFFKTLLVSSTPPIFDAQTIRGSSPILDGRRFSIDFSDQDGVSLRVIVPTLIMHDYLSVLEKQLPQPLSGTAKTAFFRLPQTWGTATSDGYRFVLLFFDDELPIAVDSRDARTLAGELLQLAEQIENRCHSTQ